MPSTVYGVCAAVAGTILLVQIAMSFLGADHGLDGDFDGDTGGHGEHPDSGSFFGILSFRTIVAALTFFGLAGLGGERSGWSSSETLAAALVAGALALYGTYWLGVGLNRLQADATARPQDAIGCSGNVYLRIPGGHGGAGKVQLSQQGRTIEYEAVTAGPELTPGQNVVVVGLVGAETLEVELSNR